MKWRWAYMLMVCVSTLFLLLSARTFYGRYYFTRANRGARSLQENERLLRRSLVHDPSYGYSSLQIARLLMMQKAYGGALEYQLEGMRSFRPVNAYMQLGSIEERIGRRSDAQKHFTQALLMRPGNLQALEWLAYFAYQAGEQALLEHYLAEIANYDIENLNALYLRASDAMRRGNRAAAYVNLQRISSALQSSDAPAGAFFHKSDIEAQLASMRPKRNTR